MTRRAHQVLAAGCWAASVVTLVRGVGGLARMRASLAWLNSRPQTTEPAPTGGLRLVVLLPLLREQRLLAETLAYFRALQCAWPGMSVVLVTTERERVDRATAAARLDTLADALATGQPAARIVHRYLGVLPRDRLLRLADEVTGQPRTACHAAVQAAFADLPTTDQLAAALAAQAQAEGADVRHYHDPNPRAAMAHQLNFAARAELHRLTAAGTDLGDCYLTIYNADSRPEPATFPVLAQTIADLERTTGTRPAVLQQSALFTRNLAELGSGASGVYLRGAALLQSRWTLAHEIPTLHRQARTARRQAGWRWLGHCTGHGLFIRADVFAAWQGLPTATMNEDLAFGFLLSAAGTPIYPVPALEWADSPETLWAVLRQKRQWFWSYVDYPAFARLAATARLGTRWRRTTLAAQGLARGVAWLATSPTVACTLALPLVRRRPAAAAMSAAALGAYYVAPFALLLAELRRRGQPAEQLGPLTIAGGLAAYLTHSVGPWWCCASALRRLTGTGYSHDKTER